MRPEKDRQPCNSGVLGDGEANPELLEGVQSTGQSKTLAGLQVVSPVWGGNPGHRAVI